MTDSPRTKRKLGRVDLERMNLPEDLWLAKIQGVSESARDSVEKYLRNIDDAVARGAGLMIHGASGVGKSGIAALVAKEARSWGYTTMFCRLWELREMIRSRVPFDSDTSMSERAREVEVLVLDDLRQEDAREKFFGLSEIGQLVRYRASRRRLTIVTTRLSVVVLDAPPMDVMSDVLLLFPVEGPNLRDERMRELEQSILGT